MQVTVADISGLKGLSDLADAEIDTVIKTMEAGMRVTAASVKAPEQLKYTDADGVTTTGSRLPVEKVCCMQRCNCLVAARLLARSLMCTAALQAPATVLQAHCSADLLFPSA